jgi:hypothetical protein
MEGMVHAPFNAALLETVSLAYPNSPISFGALPSHTAAVQELLAQHAPDLLHRITWHSLAVPASASVVTRWLHNRRLLRHVLERRHRTLFCSISRMQLLQLKRMMLGRDTGHVRAVLHGELDVIDGGAEHNSSRHPFSLARVLLSPQPTGLRYVLLGRTILDNIPAQFRASFLNAGVLEHPYHFASPAQVVEGPPVIGIFGNVGDGSLLESVARSVKSKDPSICFRLIGFLSDQSAVERLHSVVEDAHHEPLARTAFAERTHRITHAMWLAPPGSFRLRASGTFFDALSFVKPLVFTANSFIDGYFALEPGIGWRSESVSDVPETILNLVRDHNSERYAAAQAAILRLRERFTPQAQAKFLPEALDWD